MATDRIILLIGMIVFFVLNLACAITMLTGFVYSISGNKVIGKKLIKFGAVCGVIAWGSALTIAAWTKHF